MVNVVIVPDFKDIHTYSGTIIILVIYVLDICKKKKKKESYRRYIYI